MQIVYYVVLCTLTVVLFKGLYWFLLIAFEVTEESKKERYNGKD